MSFDTIPIHFYNVFYNVHQFCIAIDIVAKGSKKFEKTVSSINKISFDLSHIKFHGRPGNMTFNGLSNPGILG